MTAAAIHYGWERPQPLPFDFIFTPTHVERVAIAGKKEGVAFPPPFGNYTTPAYFVFVTTKHGDLRISVSKKVFEALSVGDSTVVQYQRGRWTSALKGRIAR